jgi:hypothetical protein
VEYDQSRFDAVVEAVRELLGPDHADVVALSTQATGGSPDAFDPVTAPPMLWRSWVLLIEASNAAPALLPVATWSRTLRLLPLRPFFIWAPEDTDAESSDDWRNSLQRALATAKREPTGDERVSDVLAESAAEADRPGDVEASDETRSRVSRELFVPRAAIDEVASPPR